MIIVMYMLKYRLKLIFFVENMTYSFAEDRWSAEFKILTIITIITSRRIKYIIFVLFHFRCYQWCSQFYALVNFLLVH